ncbi:TetR family transcriptional regulator [Paenibacillus cellulosilyticus]|uniref:TetR family transcriptional regulator n=1 Tax=Paenibacillus cellulosilyticus TaxID=375489 RepID=A0A2V2YSY6_9BACL|nr:TetR/AcrR family transcriptional regulator [Paenibacillus cellulosilyticus]PWW02427.1 TetR family transcriptional regulator [Paenibacillus cellulosilyticus]QKS47138.1 TetR/AcrR family transcriptional regulator [Paenibacillus cellulosilyticus]
MTSLVNKEDPRAKKTRRSLRNALIELLAEKEFSSITIQHITDRAELNRATFYGHFQDKFELLDETLGELLEEAIRRRIPADPGNDGTALVRGLMLAVCDWHLETTHRLNRKLTLSASLEANAKKNLYEIILACLQQLEPLDTRHSRSQEIKSTVISWSIYGIVLQWSEQTRSESVEALAEQALPLIMASVRTP